MTATATDTTPKVHLSLNVADLDKSIAFYRVLFGIEPAKCYDDYAKFELDDPPVVFALQPGPRPPGASLSHIGLRVRSAEAILDVQRRLEEAGIPTQRQNGVVCGYARQSKCWVADPDGNFWEIYILEADVDPRAGKAHLARLVPEDGLANGAPPALAWQHQLGQEIPRHLPFADGAVGEVRLEGTCNADLDDGQLAALLAEVRRALRPGAAVHVHALVADQPLPPGPLSLPGPAAAVRRVPVVGALVQALTAAGFVGIHFPKLGDKPCFQLGPVSMREMRLVGYQPGAAAGEPARRVIYKGPLAQVRDFQGNLYPRGQRVAVTDATWDLLHEGPAAEQFLFLTPDAGPSCGAG